MYDFKDSYFDGDIEFWYKKFIRHVNTKNIGEVMKYLDTIHEEPRKEIYTQLFALTKKLLKK